MILRKTLIASLILHALVFFISAVASTGRPEPARRAIFVELKEEGAWEEKKAAFDKHASHLKPSPYNIPEIKKMPVIEIKEEKEEISFINDIGSIRIDEAMTDSTASGGAMTQVEGSVQVEGFVTLSDGGSVSGISIGTNTFEIRRNTINDALSRVKHYPLMARKRKMEGTVTAGFYIDENGAPHDMRILKSSGHALLDDEVIKMIQRASPYPVKKIEVEVEVPIKFSLTEEGQ